MALEQHALESITHTCELVERHRITILVSDTPDLTVRQRTDLARSAAAQWAGAHGLAITLDAVAGSSTRPGSAFNGVEFEVIVGKGDIALDQRMPGVLDAWRWSGRFDWWRKVFNRMDGREGRKIVAREEANRVVQFPGGAGGGSGSFAPGSMIRSQWAVGGPAIPDDSLTAQAMTPDVPCAVDFDGRFE